MTRQEILNHIESFASKHNLAFSDRKDKVVDGLVRNMQKYGVPTCPCRKFNKENPDKDLFCPCVHVLKEVERDGHCYCNLFTKK